MIATVERAESEVVPEFGVPLGFMLVPFSYFGRDVMGIVRYFGWGYWIRWWWWQVDKCGSHGFFRSSTSKWETLREVGFFVY